MHSTIVANVATMFASIEPYYVSGSRFELGDSAGRITWNNALTIAGNHPAWLSSPVDDAVEDMRDWARRTGAWDREEIAAWSTEECLALFVQNVASELRMLGSDDADLESCVAKYRESEWDKEPEYPIGYYYVENGSVHVDYYVGI